MSRSVADATRFTATSPHAYSKTAMRAATAIAPNLFPSSSKPPPGPSTFKGPPPLKRTSQPGPPGETPQQKVARLRRQREIDKMKSITTWDKIVVNGRRWADRIHIYSVLTLVLFAVGAGIVTVFSLADMIMYNRKKRQAYYSAQTTLYAQTVHEALVNRAAGRPLTEDQELCLQRERFQLEAQQAAEEKAKNGGMIRQFFLGGLKNEDEENTAEDEKEEISPNKRPKEKVGRDGKIKGLESVISESKVLEALQAKEKEEKQSLSEGRGYHVGDIDKLAVEANERGAELVGVAETKLAEKGREFEQVGEHLLEESKEEAQKAKGLWSSWLGFGR